MHYKLREGSPQHGFHNSRAKMQIFGGGFGNGKTTALVIKALRLCIDYPGSNGLLARSTYPKLNDTLRKVFFQWCPEHWIAKKPTQESNTCVLVNGTHINFRYIAQRGKQSESGDTTSNLLSATYDWIGIDQCEDPEITHKDLMDLFGRLRGDTPYRPRPGQDDETMPDSGPRWLMATLNPSRNWFYKEIIQPYQMWQKRGIYSEKLMVDEETRKPIIELFEGSTYTNSDNLKPDYIKTLESTFKGQMRDRYLYGKWAAYEGLVYPVYDPEKHMLKREFVLDYMEDCLNRRDVHLQPLEMYDFGLTSPSCYALGFVDDLSRVFIIDGFHKANFSYMDQPAEIMRIRQKYPLDYDRIIADPAIFRRQVVSGMRTGESVKNLLSTGNNLIFRQGTNDTTAGIAKVSAYLGGLEDTPHIVTGEAPGPLLYFVDDMPWIEEEFLGYYWRKSPSGIVVDEPQDGNDHFMDALKYGLSFRPKPSEIIIPSKKLPPKWLFWHEEKDARPF